MKIRSILAAGCVKRTRAFTLLEVMIGALVVAVLLASYLATLESSLAMMRVGRENLRATEIMVNHLEGIRLYRWDQLTDTSLLPTNFVEYYSTNTSGSTAYTGAVSVVSATLNPSATYSSSIYSINIQVQWASGNVLHTRQMTTYQAKDGIQSYVYRYQQKNPAGWCLAIMNTNSFQRHARTWAAGMTLVEMMVSVVIGSVIIAAAVSFFLFSAYSIFGLGNYDDLERSSRNAVDRMSRDIRGASTMTSFATNQVAFTDKATGAAFSYTYNSAKGSLVRTWAGSSSMLLSNCSYLTFSIFERDPSNGFNFYPANGVAANAKVVDVTWKCARQIMASSRNSEAMQDAKIVIRNN